MFTSHSSEQYFASVVVWEVRISLSVDEDPDIMIQQRVISKVRDFDLLEFSMNMIG